MNDEAFHKNDEALISDAKRYIEELFRGNADGHDLSHSLRVYQNACLLAEHFPDCRRRVVVLAALLHDTDDYKLFSTANNENARRFLVAHGLPAEEIEQILTAINSVSYSRNRENPPATVEGEIVQDADRLDAIGAIGIARTFAYSGTRGRPLGDSVRHFYDKLLLLKDEMNTEPAKQLAVSRHALMEQFLAALEGETGGLV